MKKNIIISIFVTTFLIFSLGTVASAQTSNSDIYGQNTVNDISTNSLKYYYSDYQVPYHSGHFPGNPLNLANGVMYYDYSTYIGGGDYIAHYHGSLF